MQLLLTGQVTALTQDVPYALPATTVFVMSSAALEYSLDNSTWVALTGSNTTGVNCSAPFIRCHTGTANVVIKKLQ